MRTASIAAIFLLTACGAGLDPNDPAADDDMEQEGSTGDDGVGEEPEPPETTDGDGSTGDDGVGEEPELPETTGDDGSTGDESTGEEPEPPPGLGCDRDDLLLCDDFEDGVIDDALWSVIEQNGATVSIDEDFSYHGGGALRISLPSAGGARAGLLTRDGTVFPVPYNHFFGRAYFHVGPTAPQSHSAAIAAHGDLDGAPARYRLDSNGGRFNSRYVHNPTVEQHGGLKKFGYDVPAQQWLCIEWEYDGDNNAMRYWMDGEAIDSMTVVQTPDEQPWIAPIFEQMEIGWRTYQAADPADVHWDALALASTRIGCE